MYNYWLCVKNIFREEQRNLLLICASAVMAILSTLWVGPLIAIIAFVAGLTSMILIAAIARL